MHKRRITVRGIIVKDGKLFCQRLKKDGGRVNDYWCTPGGGLDPYETLEQGLKREMIEETGVAPTIGKLLFVQQYNDDEWEYLEFFFHVTNPDDYRAIDLESTSHGLIEVDSYDFIDPKAHYVLPAFLASIDLDSYLTGRRPTLVSSGELT